MVVISKHTKYKTEEERVAARKESYRKYNLTKRVTTRSKKDTTSEKYKKQHIEQSKRYRLKYPEKVKETQKNYHIKNRDSRNIKSKEYRQQHLDIIKENQREYHIKNKITRNTKTKEWYHKNESRLCEEKRIIYEKLKKDVMLLLGGIKCNYCGEIDIDILQIDHIHGGGTEEHRRIRSARYLKKILDNSDNSKKNYQILCANCNIIKRITNNENKSQKTLTPRMNYERNYRNSLKIKAMTILGGVFCKKCGLGDEHILQIDHIKGGGTKELKKINTFGVYKKIIYNPECQEDYQVLCGNCNVKKRVINRETPRKYN